jgi:hypothetical protein
LDIVSNKHYLSKLTSSGNCIWRKSFEICPAPTTLYWPNVSSDIKCIKVNNEDQIIISGGYFSYFNNTSGLYYRVILTDSLGCDGVTPSLCSFPPLEAVVSYTGNQQDGYIFPFELTLGHAPASVVLPGGNVMNNLFILENYNSPLTMLQFTADTIVTFLFTDPEGQESTYELLLPYEPDTTSNIGFHTESLSATCSIRSGVLSVRALGKPVSFVVLNCMGQQVAAGTSRSESPAELTTRTWAPGVYYVNCPGAKAFKFVVGL